MPYQANDDRTVDYVGNRVFDPVESVLRKDQPYSYPGDRIAQFSEREYWSDVTRINSIIHRSVTEFFHSFDALFVPLPQTSPEVTVPGSLFGTEGELFVAVEGECHPLLDCVLVQPDVDQVFSIYNGVRDEDPGATRLSEFHHIDFAGLVSQDSNERILEELLERIIGSLIEEGGDALSHFLDDEQIERIRAINERKVERITFEEALDILSEETGDERYEEFTLEHYGTWEQVKISNLVEDRLVCISEFPIDELEYYVDMTENREGRLVGKNADYLWPGYLEIASSAELFSDVESIRQKAEMFNVGPWEYQPYVQTRKAQEYDAVAGFGLGLERLVQGILQMPTIVDSTPYPRVPREESHSC